MPPGSVEKQHGVGALSDIARDFVEVKLHHVGVGVGQREGRPDASRRADGAEQIGVVICENATREASSMQTWTYSQPTPRPLLWPVRSPVMRWSICSKRPSFLMSA